MQSRRLLFTTRLPTFSSPVIAATRTSMPRVKTGAQCLPHSANAQFRCFTQATPWWAETKMPAIQDDLQPNHRIIQQDEKEDELETLDPAEFPELFESESAANELAGEEDGDDEQVVDTEWFVDNAEEEFVPLWQRRAMDDAFQDRQALEQVSKKLVETGDMSPDILRSMLEENNMEKIQVLDVRGKCDFTNYMIVAESSMGDRSLVNTAELLKQTLKKAINKHFVGDERQKPVIRIEGLDDQSGWILVDLGHCVVHLFTPEVRERYNLEGLWKENEKDQAEETL